MALNAGTVAPGGAGVGLAKEMYDDYIGKLGGLGIPPGSIVAEQQIADICNSFAKTIIAHFVANAVVATTTTSTVVVTSVSGVTTGPGVSGPGAGTASGSGTGGIT